MLGKITLLAAAGACGALARYGLSGFVQQLGGARFAWGTLAVNALGCLLFGFIWTLAEERLIISGETRAILLTGFMGAFTTFSTYAFETAGFLNDSQWTLASVNIFAQNALGLVCVLAGLAAGRWLIGMA